MIKLQKIYHFYKMGFSNMVVGKTLWKIILIKLFIMFAVLKVFFFPNFLQGKFSTDQQRGSYVIDNITKKYK